jgi:ribosomal protein S27AE
MNSQGKTREPMSCPRCGTKMNHHAEKIVYVREAGDFRQADLMTGSLLDQIHACPNCGASASRPASN